MKQFIQEKAPAIAGLRVEYVRGADPSLVMRTAAGEEESISINTWTKDTLDEFFAAKMNSAP